MDRPKSPTLTAPSGDTKQLDGLMSLWSTPRSSAASSPSIMFRVASTASVTGSGPRRSRTSWSVPPGAISMVITGIPSISSLPNT